MWVSGKGARQMVIGLVLVALVLVGLAVAFLDVARALLVWRFLRVVLLVLALWLATEMLALRGPDPEVPRHVLDVPSDHDLGS